VFGRGAKRRARDDDSTSPTSDCRIAHASSWGIAAAAVRIALVVRKLLRLVPPPPLSVPSHRHHRRRRVARTNAAAAALDERTNERTNKQTNKRTNERTNEPTDRDAATQLDFSVLTEWDKDGNGVDEIE